MNDNSGLVLLEVTNIEEGFKEFKLNKRYLDGVAVNLKEVNLSELRVSLSPEYLKELHVMLILGVEGYNEGINEVVNLVGMGNTEILLAFNDMQSMLLSKSKLPNTVKVGLVLNHPAPTLSPYQRAGAGFIVMPPTLIRGRILSESKARKINIIARLVNDVTICTALLEVGVYAIVTKIPAIKRDARKKLK